jgi:hypothetical protein
VSLEESVLFNQKQKTEKYFSDLANAEVEVASVSAAVNDFIKELEKILLL